VPSCQVLVLLLAEAAEHDSGNVRIPDSGPDHRPQGPGNSDLADRPARVAPARARFSETQDLHASPPDRFNETRSRIGPDSLRLGPDSTRQDTYGPEAGRYVC
jgi:hypothetical protein